MKRVLVAFLFISSLLAMPSGSAQIESCGEGFTLFIRNPDITPDAQNVFHVSGRLLVQFQVIGERADEIEAFGLSFGADIPTGDEVCDLPAPAWVTGAYLEAYSLDKTKEDGFFVGINSNGQTSPQHDLGVAVHGYDGQGNELARFWGIVRLDHCHEPRPSLGCPDNPRDGVDVTMPWPIILPGDGEVRPEPNGFVFEFNEELSDLVVELNGEDVTAELEEWTERPDWDGDSAIAGPQMVVERIAPQCSLEQPTGGQVHSCGPLAGPAYKWTGRAMTDADVIRVVATDVSGNVATKEIHIGSSVAGGTISDGVPILQMTFDSIRQTAAPGEKAIFKMIMENNGGGEGHPFADAVVPEGWTFEWVPGHQPVPAGGSSEQELHVTVPVDAVDDAYVVEPVINYQQGQQEKTLRSVLNIEVVTPEGAEVDSVEEEAPKKTPSAGVFVLGLVLAALAVLRRR